MQYQGRSARKRTGGRRRPSRKKRKAELGREAAETEVGAPRLQTIDSRGGREKRRALATNVATVAHGGDTVEATIEGVAENPANPNYVRRNIVTKGAVIETSEGLARVTSRPGQTGQVNAVLLEAAPETGDEPEAPADEPGATEDPDDVAETADGSTDGDDNGDSDTSEASDDSAGSDGSADE